MADVLTIKKSEGPVKVLHLGGKLDGQTQESLMSVARAEQAAGTRYLVIDLKELQMISSAGLGALHNIYKHFTPRAEIEAWEESQNGQPYKSAYFKLAAAPANIYYVLNIAGFLNNIPIYPDLEAALKSFPV